MHAIYTILCGNQRNTISFVLTTSTGRRACDFRMFLTKMFEYKSFNFMRPRFSRSKQDSRIRYMRLQLCLHNCQLKNKCIYSFKELGIICLNSHCTQHVVQRGKLFKRRLQHQDLIYQRWFYISRQTSI